MASAGNTTLSIPITPSDNMATTPAEQQLTKTEKEASCGSKLKSRHAYSAQRCTVEFGTLDTASVTWKRELQRKIKPLSLRGIWHGVDFSDEEIEQAKCSWFKSGYNGSIQ